MIQNSQAQNPIDLFSGDEIPVGVKPSGGDEFLNVMRHLAAMISNVQGSVTCDDLRAGADAMFICPPHPNYWGAIFRPAEFVNTGMRISRRRNAKARRIAVWEFKGVGVYERTAPVRKIKPATSSELQDTFTAVGFTPK